MGDFNGDGYDDVLIGDDQYSNSETSEGRLYVHLGSSGGIAATPDWECESNVANAQLGYSATSLGDINGDGFDDFGAGAIGETSSGRVYVYLGSADGVFACPFSSVIDGEFGHQQYGTFLARAGDVNGDGLSDVLVGDPTYSKPELNEGRAQLLYGSEHFPYLVEATADASPWSYEPDSGGAVAGRVSTAGDMNLDGYSDFIVGAPDLTPSGTVLAFLGSPTGPQPAPYPALLGGNDFGTVGFAGDVNQDGRGDLITGAPSAGGELGTVAVWAGQDGIPVQIDQQTGNNPGNRLGATVGGAGDFNADGISDIWFLGRGSSTYNGQFFIYPMTPSGFESAIIVDPSGITQLTDSNCAAGDVNGDGFSDLALGLPDLSEFRISYGGSVSGGPSFGLPLLPRQLSSCLAARLGLRALSRGPDDIEIEVLGRSPAGREAVWLAVEAKSLTEPGFNGLGLLMSQQADTGFPGVRGSVTTLVRTLDGLQPEEFFHWRAQVRCSNPFFPRSRWVSIQGNGIAESKVQTPLVNSIGVDCDGDSIPDVCGIDVPVVGVDCGTDGIVDTCGIAITVGVIESTSMMNLPGIEVQTSMTDNCGDGSGVAPFDRHFDPSTTIDLEIAAVPPLTVFLHWEVDGVEQPSGQTLVPVSIDVRPVDTLAVFVDPYLYVLAQLEQDQVPGEPTRHQMAALTYTEELLYSGAPTIQQLYESTDLTADLEGLSEYIALQSLLGNEKLIQIEANAFLDNDEDEIPDNALLIEFEGEIESRALEGIQELEKLLPYVSMTQQLYSNDEESVRDLVFALEAIARLQLKRAELLSMPALEETDAQRAVVPSMSEEGSSYYQLIQLRDRVAREMHFVRDQIASGVVTAVALATPPMTPEDLQAEQRRALAQVGLSKIEPTVFINRARRC